MVVLGVEMVRQAVLGVGAVGIPLPGEPQIKEIVTEAPDMETTGAPEQETMRVVVEELGR